MTSTLRPIALIVLCGLLTSGCDLSDATSSDRLDADLRNALVRTAPQGDLGFFVLPDADDLRAIPQDPQNPLTPEKIRLGRLLFHDAGLLTTPARPEGMQTASCATCHHASAGFQAGRVQGIGEGGRGFAANGAGRTAHNDWLMQKADLDVQPIRTPTAMNTAYQEVMLWNGQFGATGPNAGTNDRWSSDTPLALNRLGYQGLETQAIAGLTTHRMGDVRTSVAGTHDTYIDLFADAFPGQPIDQERAGLAIAAYERTLLANQAPFQKWLRGRPHAMTDAQKRGALVFFDKANCAQCHTGPALSSDTFHALGMGDLEGANVFGPTGGQEVRGRAAFTGNPNEAYAFKTPQLYNLADSPFLGHGGTFRSIRAVVEYKNQARPENPRVPKSALADDFRPLHLSKQEIRDLVAFLREGLYDPNLERYVPHAVPSGACIPANDPAAREDLGC